jgi:ABC-type oligopeptide transport system ATPase subunit
MPITEKHVEISLKRTGREYREVHEWIDDPVHKYTRHDINAIPDTFQMFKEKFGEEAAREYVQHLSDDIKARFEHVLEDFEKEMALAIKYFGSK